MARKKGGEIDCFAAEWPFAQAAFYAMLCPQRGQELCRAETSLKGAAGRIFSTVNPRSPFVLQSAFHRSQQHALHKELLRKGVSNDHGQRRQHHGGQLNGF